MSDPADRIWFLADENFREAIVAGLRRKQPDIDIMTAVEAGLLHVDDPLVLEYAAHHQRVLLTHDKRTMPQYLNAFLLALKSDAHSPGVFLVPQLTATGDAIEDLLLIWEASAPSEWQDRITYLPL